MVPPEALEPAHCMEFIKTDVATMKFGSDVSLLESLLSLEHRDILGSSHLLPGQSPLYQHVSFLQGGQKEVNHETSTGSAIFDAGRK